MPEPVMDYVVTPTRISNFIRERILSLRRQGKTIAAIKRELIVTDRTKISRQAISAFIGRYDRTGSIQDIRVDNRPSKLTAEHAAFIDRLIHNDREISARELTDSVNEHFNLNVSTTTVKRARLKLGWKRSRTQYCQMVRDVNKPKRLEFAINCIINNETYDDVIFTDETTVKIQTTTRHRFRKEGEQTPAVGTPKHPYQVHVWAGISRRGATTACIFTGIMNSEGYQEILSDTLLPFIRTSYPDGHRLMQDNDPKHVSRSTKAWLNANGVNHWVTPPESPDMNPIENLWAVLKHYIRRRKKPRNQQQLVEGIREFWEALTPADCCRYIDHLYRVVPKVVEVEGAASGY